MASRTAFVYDSPFPLKSLETFFIRHSKDVFNRLEFSRALEDAKRLCDGRHSLSVMDVDAPIIVDGVIRAGFEIKTLREDVVNYGGYVKVNGRQYEGYMEFVRRTGIDVYYLVRVQARGGDYFYSWNVKRAPVRFEWLGSRENGTYDYYALIRRSAITKLADHEELVKYLRDLIFGR
ncbi:hypothetical protein [Thermococcus barophilus]|uniref:Uncharacterized protein n=1 Tax=Thermococcus barophilus TaxID=55802 RepID=A0A0S1XAT7_THEBA|nr:hypothetical protein [Thermococcus barophilus]ALM74868.1 hypothetical protein TBCH5v1_0919 [Thermococcus barophilus]